MTTFQQSEFEFKSGAAVECLSVSVLMFLQAIQSGFYGDAPLGNEKLLEN